MSTDGEPPQGLIGAHQLPNLICVLRVIVTFTGLGFLGHIHLTEDRWSTPWIVVLTLAALSDRLDGFLAKRYGWSTALGAVLDQISDKLVTLALFCFLAVLQAFPLWGVALIVFRELFVTCLRISANLEQIAIPTSQAGRFKTFTQQVAVLLIFMHWGWPEPVVGEATAWFTLTLAQCLLWGGWAIFWGVMLALAKKTFAGLRRVYSVEREDPRTGETSTSVADLVLVYATIVAMGIPLPYAGPTVVLVITVGTGVTYWAAYLWARRVRERFGGPGRRNIALALVGSAVLSVGLVLILDASRTLTTMWVLVGVLSVVWTVLLTISYRTGRSS